MSYPAALSLLGNTVRRRLPIARHAALAPLSTTATRRTVFDLSDDPTPSFPASTPTPSRPPPPPPPPHLPHEAPGEPQGYRFHQQDQQPNQRSSPQQPSRPQPHRPPPNRQNRQQARRPGGLGGGLPTTSSGKAGDGGAAKWSSKPPYPTKVEGKFDVAWSSPRKRETIYVRCPFPAPEPRPPPEPLLSDSEPETTVYDVDVLLSRVDWTRVVSPGTAPKPDTRVPVYPAWDAEVEQLRDQVNQRVPVQVRHVPMQAPFNWYQQSKYNGPGRLPGFATPFFNARICAMRRKRAPRAPSIPGLRGETLRSIRRPLFKMSWVPDVVEPYTMKEAWVGVLADPSLRWRHAVGTKGSGTQATTTTITVSEQERLMYSQNVVQNAEEDRVIRVMVIAGKKTVHKLAAVRWGAASRVVGVARVVWENLVERTRSHPEDTQAQSMVDALTQLAQQDMSMIVFARLGTMECSGAQLHEAVYNMFARFARSMPFVHRGSYPRRRFEQPQRGDVRRVPHGRSPVPPVGQPNPPPMNKRRKERPMNGHFHPGDRPE